MRLSNQEIEARVQIIAKAYLDGVKVRESDKPVIAASVQLVSNLLSNINDIAESLSQGEEMAEVADEYRTES
jgi:hypothetical protein